MTATHESSGELAGREIVIDRAFNAPRELLFDTWINPKHVAKWWGPKGFTLTTHAMDVRPGGVWRFTMHGPDGTDYENKIVYDEVVKPERLVYSHSGERDDDPAQFQVTVTFTEEGNKTHLTMRMIFQSAAQREKVVKQFGAIEGANQTLDRLEAHLAQL